MNEKTEPKPQKSFNPVDLGWKVLIWIKRAWMTSAVVIGSLILFGYIMIFISIGTENTRPDIDSPYEQEIVEAGNEDQQIAVVDIKGIILSELGEEDIFSASDGVADASELVPLLEYLQETDQVKAVILDINSPGGGVVGSDLVYQAVAKLAEKKPVVARFGDVAASGGYYVAAGADKIVSHPSTITGSIGVIMQVPNFTDLFNNLGIEMTTVTSGEFKDIAGIDDEVTDDERAILQSIIDDAYGEFVTAVSEGREMGEDEVRRLADGRIYSGRQALDNNLVDELGDLSTAIEVSKEEIEFNNPKVVRYSTEKTLLETLLSAAYSPLGMFARQSNIQNAQMYYLME